MSASDIPLAGGAQRDAIEDQGRDMPQEDHLRYVFTRGSGRKRAVRALEVARRVRGIPPDRTTLTCPNGAFMRAMRVCPHEGCGFEFGPACCLGGCCRDCSIPCANESTCPRCTREVTHACCEQRMSMDTLGCCQYSGTCGHCQSSDPSAVAARSRGALSGPHPDHPSVGMNCLFSTPYNHMCPGVMNLLTADELRARSFFIPVDKDQGKSSKDDDGNDKGPMAQSIFGPIDRTTTMRSIISGKRLGLVPPLGVRMRASAQITSVLDFDATIVDPTEQVAQAEARVKSLEALNTLLPASMQLPVPTACIEVPLSVPRGTTPTQALLRTSPGEFSAILNRQLWRANGGAMEHKFPITGMVPRAIELHGYRLGNALGDVIPAVTTPMRETPDAVRRMMIQRELVVIALLDAGGVTGESWDKAAREDADARLERLGLPRAPLFSTSHLTLCQAIRLDLSKRAGDNHWAGASALWGDTVAILDARFGQRGENATRILDLMRFAHAREWSNTPHVDAVRSRLSADALSPTQGAFHRTRSPLFSRSDCGCILSGIEQMANVDVGQERTHAQELAAMYLEPALFKQLRKLHSMDDTPERAARVVEARQAIVSAIHTRGVAAVDLTSYVTVADQEAEVGGKHVFPRPGTANSELALWVSRHFHFLVMSRGTADHQRTALRILDLIALDNLIGDKSLKLDLIDQQSIDEASGEKRVRREARRARQIKRLTKRGAWRPWMSDATAFNAIDTLMHRALRSLKAHGLSGDTSKILPMHVASLRVFVAKVRAANPINEREVVRSLSTSRHTTTAVDAMLDCGPVPASGIRVGQDHEAQDERDARAQVAGVDVEGAIPDGAVVNPAVDVLVRRLDGVHWAQNAHIKQQSPQAIASKQGKRVGTSTGSDASARNASPDPSLVSSRPHDPESQALDMAKRLGAVVGEAQGDRVVHEFFVRVMVMLMNVARADNSKDEGKEASLIPSPRDGKFVVLFDQGVLDDWIADAILPLQMDQSVASGDEAVSLRLHLIPGTAHPDVKRGEMHVSVRAAMAWNRLTAERETVEGRVEEENRDIDQMIKAGILEESPTALREGVVEASSSEDESKLDEGERRTRPRASRAARARRRHRLRRRPRPRARRARPSKEKRPPRSGAGSGSSRRQGGEDDLTDGED